MMRRCLVGLLSVSLMLASVACASCKKKPAFSNGEKTSGVGVFTLIGSEPLARPAIRLPDDKTVLFLDRTIRKSKEDLIGKKVNYAGTVSVREIESADHKYRFFEYSLNPESVTAQ